MKRLLRCSGLAVAMLQSFVQQTTLCGQPAAAPSSPGPQLQLQKACFDFGRIKNTESVQHDFLVANTGDAVLEIKAVQPECGCTVSGDWDRRIAPGKTGKIPIRFNPINFDGAVSKYFLISSNATDGGIHRAEFKAEVWRPLDIRPGFLNFEQVEGNPTNETKTIRIINGLDQALTLEPPQCPNSEFQVELKTITPGKEFELTVKFAGILEGGATQKFPITIRTSSEIAPILTIEVSVVLLPALVPMPTQIEIPPGPLGPENPFSVTVVNNGATPVQLSEPTVNVEGFTALMHEIERGKTFNVTLRAPANFHATADLPMELSVKSSLPKHPVFKVPITSGAERSDARNAKSETK